MLLDGFEAGIRTVGPNGHGLIEYGTYDKTSDRQVCWVEAKTGATFEVFWRKKKTSPRVATAGEVWIDDTSLLCGEGYLGAYDDNKTIVAKGPPINRKSVLSLEFKDLDIRGEDALHRSRPLDVSGLGVISLALQRGTYLDQRRHFDKPTPSPWAEPLYGREKFKLLCSDRTQYVGFGHEKRFVGAGACNEFVKDPDAPDGYEWTFTWLYRTKEVLQKLGYIKHEPASPFSGSLSPPPDLPSPTPSLLLPLPTFALQPDPLQPPPLLSAKDEPRQPSAGPSSYFPDLGASSHALPQPSPDLLFSPPSSSAYKRIKLEPSPGLVFLPPPPPPPSALLFQGPEGRDRSSAVFVPDDDEECQVMEDEEVQFLSKRKRAEEVQAEKKRALAREKARAERAEARRREDEEREKKEVAKVEVANEKLRTMQAARVAREAELDRQWNELL